MSIATLVASKTTILVTLMNSYCYNSVSAMACSRLRQFFQHDLYTVFDVNQSSSLSQVLLDTLFYDDGDLQLVAAELLFDMYNIEQSVLTLAEDSYLLTNTTEEETASQMKMYATFTDKDQLLKKMMKRQVRDMEELHHVLDMFSSYCLSEKDETEAHVSNQGLAYSSGMNVCENVFSSVMIYIYRFIYGSFGICS